MVLYMSTENYLNRSIRKVILTTPIILLDYVRLVQFSDIVVKQNKYWLNMRNWLVALIVFGLIVGLSALEKTTLTIASGNPEGVYFKLATALEEILEEENSQLDVIVLETSGSMEIVELMDRTNRQITLDAGANEIVSAGFYRTGIMLQSARYHNLSDIFHELLIYEENTSSIFIIESEKLPEILKGKSFQEATEIFNQNRDEKNPVILIGVRRMCKDPRTDEEKIHVILNPSLNADSHNGKFEKFEEGDSLVVLAQSYPNLVNIK